MNGPLFLRDYTRYSADPGGCDGGDTLYIPKEDLEFLQDLQEELEGEDCVFLASGPQAEEGERPQVIRTLDRGTLQTGSYVGSLVFRGRAVVIHSRFDGENHLFLRYLLENAWEVSSLVTPEPEGAAGLSQDGFYRWRLVCQLAVQLRAAWKKGSFRAYRTFSCCDSRVRGQPDIPRHIRLTMGLNDGRAAYRTREYSPDNPYNRLILCAVSAAQRRYPQLMQSLLRQLPECKAAVQLLRRQLPGADRDQPRALLERTRRQIVHPVYRGYEEVRLTARAVLRWLGQDLQEQDRTVGILLNMDQMWEKFLAGALFPNEAGDCQQVSVGLLGEHMAVRPDIYLSSRRVVLDAKNRPVWEKTLRTEKWSRSLRAGIREDVYQVLSYMLALDCSDGGVVFPVRRSRLRREAGAGGLRPSALPVSGMAKGWRFWRIPFVIPDDAETYEAFKAAVERQADEIRRFREEA